MLRFLFPKLSRKIAIEGLYWLHVAHKFYSRKPHSALFPVWPDEVEKVRNLQNHRTWSDARFDTHT